MEAQDKRGIPLPRDSPAPPAGMGLGAQALMSAQRPAPSQGARCPQCSRPRAGCLSLPPATCNPLPELNRTTAAPREWSPRLGPSHMLFLLPGRPSIFSSGLSQLLSWLPVGLPGSCPQPLPLHPTYLAAGTEESTGALGTRPQASGSRKASSHPQPGPLSNGEEPQ